MLFHSWYYMVVYCLYQLTTTCWGVPYSAITMEISDEWEAAKCYLNISSE